MILCRICEVKKDESKFSRSGAERRQCRECLTLAARDYRATSEGREAANRAMRESYRRVRIEALLRYSHGTMQCVCCGERTLEFLTIDHIDSDGAQHRRSGAAGSIGMWLRRNGWPEGYQVLCFNCNCGRALNGGVCPHESRQLRLVGQDRL